MTMYLNNCSGRNHAKIYGDVAAFYDLNNFGKEQTFAENLAVGQQCLVATRDNDKNLSVEDRKVTFGLFSFDKHAIMDDGTDVNAIVLFGKLLKSETLLQKDATQDKCYFVFFNKAGYFKQQSIIKT